MKPISASERNAHNMECARAYLAQRKRLNRIDVWEFGIRFHIGYQKARDMLLRAQLDRGEITLADLTPDMRRKLIDPNNLDLHALAAGPIMDSNELYLPAGKLSMEETIARERRGILP